MQSFIKILLLISTIIGLFVSYLSAEETKEDYAAVSIYKMRGAFHVYESNRSKTSFKDITVHFSLLKSNDDTLNINNIIKHDKAFIPVPKTETFQDTNTTYWLRVDLGGDFPSGRFVYAYADADFTEHTIAPSQALEKFTLDGLKYMKFSYRAEVDAQVYYFKLQPKQYREPLNIISVSTIDTFYASFVKAYKFQLILGLIIGLILMAGIYNAAMYYYNKDLSFLYYGLMQLFMVILLYIGTGAFIWDEDSFFSRNISFESVIGLLASLFATLFTVRFLETKKHTPKLHTLIQISLILIAIDLCISIIDRSMLIEYYILPFPMFFLVYTGYKRVRQGYKPAQFYLAGWIIFTLAIFLNIFRIGYEFFIIDPLYIGSAIEAILFSLALSYKIRMVAKAKEEQKELLVHQSKLASMGEMIGNIAHQWRQPLTHLSYTMMNLKEAQKHGELDEKYLTKKVDNASTQIEFMSQTIDDFKAFYAPHKEKETFSLALATQETLDIIQHACEQNHIHVTLVCKEESTLHNYKNEYKQVLLNLIANAKDALLEREIPQPHIRITVDTYKVIVEDNAGGIKKEVLPKIFEPYFTTKEGSTGIGLYMSKMIIERNMGGTLQVQSNTKGSQFMLTF